MTSHTLRSFACTSGSASRSASLRTVYRPAHHNTTVMSGRQVDDCAHDFATGMQLSASARPQLPHDKRRTTQCGERSRHGGEGLVKVQSSSPQSAACCAPDLICCKIRPNQIRLRSASHVCRSGERAQHQSQRLVALPPLPPTPPPTGRFCRLCCTCPSLRGPNLRFAHVLTVPSFYASSPQRTF